MDLWDNLFALLCLMFVFLLIPDLCLLFYFYKQAYRPSYMQFLKHALTFCFKLTNTNWADINIINMTSDGIWIGHIGANAVKISENVFFMRGSRREGGGAVEAEPPPPFKI